MIESVHSYWQGKFRKRQTLFAINEPSVDKVGHLIKVTCGHNGRPNITEMTILSIHIDLAGFSIEESSLEDSNTENNALEEQSVDASN